MLFDTLIMRGGHVASFVKVRTVVKEETALRADGRRQTDERKANVALAHPYYEGK